MWTHTLPNNVYSFSTKALIFVIKDASTQTNMAGLTVLTKKIVHKMYPSTENKIDDIFFAQCENEWMNDVQMILQNEGTGWYTNAANSKFMNSLRLFGCLIFKLFELS